MGRVSGTHAEKCGTRVHGAPSPCGRHAARHNSHDSREELKLCMGAWYRSGWVRAGAVAALLWLVTPNQRTVLAAVVALLAWVKEQGALGALIGGLAYIPVAL